MPVRRISKLVLPNRIVVPRETAIAQSPDVAIGMPLAFTAQ